MKKNILILLAIVVQTTMIHTFSLSDTWNRTKNKAYSTKENFSKKWDNFDELTKNAIIGTGVATAAAAVVAGGAYAGYNTYKNQPSSKKITSDPTQDKETFDQLISFLSTDPNYAKKPELQKNFLKRFEISDDQKNHILDIVQYEENLKK